MATDTDESPKRAFMRDGGEKTAIIKFDGQSRMMHQGVLRASRVFTKAVDGSFKEGIESMIEVEGRKEVVFMVLDWFYTKEIPSDVQMDDVDLGDFSVYISDEPDLDIDKRSLVLIAMYIFADLYDILSLRNQLIELMHTEWYTGRMHLIEMQVITNSLPPASRLYKLAVVIFVQRNYRLFEEHGPDVERWSELPTDFWQAVAGAAIKLLNDAERLDEPLPPLEKYKEV